MNNRDKNNRNEENRFFSNEEIETHTDTSNEEFEPYTDEMLDAWLPDTSKNQSKAPSPTSNRTTQKTHASQDLSSVEQFKIMVVFLIFACLVFAVVYLFSPHNSNSANTTPLQGEVSTEPTQPSQLEPSSQIPQESYQSPVDSSQEPLESQISEVPAPSTSYDYITKASEETHYGDLILVNRYHECKTDGEDTVSIYEYKTNTYIVVNAITTVNRSIMEPLNNMMDDFHDVQGATDVMVTSAYRSYNTQVTLFNREVESRGSEEAAEKWVARPGCSEHQTGLVIDFDLSNKTGTGGIEYNGTGVYEWINQNCQYYGFIIRYPEDKESITGISYEPWHFRYVGVPHAIYMKQHNLCLEEYIELLHTHSLDNPLKITYEDKEWFVYSVAAYGDTVDIPVPKENEYTISGDNCGNFIVCYSNNTTAYE